MAEELNTVCQITIKAIMMDPTFKTTTKPPDRARIRYKNWSGIVSWRTILPERILFGSTEWHPEEQWLLQAWDADKNERRFFAMRDIQKWGE